MLCNISQNAMRQPGGGTEVRVPPPPGCLMAFWEMLQSIMGYGYPPLGGGTEVRVPPPRGGDRGLGNPPPGGGYRDPGTPPGGGVGTRVGQQKEYSLHGGRYASCVHAGGLSCLVNWFNWLHKQQVEQKEGNLHVFLF